MGGLDTEVFDITYTSTKAIVPTDITLGNQVVTRSNTFGEQSLTTGITVLKNYSTTIRR